MEDEQLYTEAMGKTLTLLKNENEMLPLKSEKTIGHLALGEDSSTVFLNQLKKYGAIKSFKDISVSNALEKTANVDTLIVSFHRSNENPWKASDFSEEQLQILRKLAQYKTLILAVFVKPPDINELIIRLKQRGEESPEKIAMRVAKAPTEMATAPQFDTIILNDDLATALQDAENLVNDFLNK